MQVSNYADYVDDYSTYSRIRPSSKYSAISKDDAFLLCIDDLLKSEFICTSKNFIQHGSTTCYQHQLSVSYYTYKICKALKLNFYEASRGAMLHDMFLYDWHDLKGRKKFIHPSHHPKVALENCRKFLSLTKIEEDIILNHMWPLTIHRLPKYAETYVVTLVDKMCCIAELIGNLRKNKTT